MNEAAEAAAGQGAKTRFRLLLWAARHRVLLWSAASVALLLAMIFARVMNYELRRDENLYAAPALLLRDFDLYADVFYNHTPLSAWLFRAAKVVTGSESLIFPARLVIFGAWAGLAAAVLRLSWLLTRSRLMTAFLFLAVMTNDALLSVTGMAATNNFLPLPLIYVGVGLFLVGAGRKQPSPWMFLAAGLALGLAGSVKISAAIVGPVILAAALFIPAHFSAPARLRDVAAPIAFGGLIGAAPILTYLKNIPDIFIANILSWHVGPHTAYWRTLPAEPLEAAMSIGGKAVLGFAVWTAGANALLIVAFVMLVVLAAAHYRRSGAPIDRRFAPVAAVMVLLAAGSFLPTPSFPQYFSPPIIVAPLLLALLYASLDAEAKAKASAGLVALCIALPILNLPRLTKDAALLPFPDRWAVSEIHAAGQSISARMAAAGAEGKVATLAPLYALEGDLPVYPALATGPFAYRAAPFTTPTLADKIVVIAPGDIAAMLTADPPGALLLGIAPALEAPFLRFAMENGYRAVDGFEIKDRDGALRLYLRDRPAPGAPI